MEQKYKDIYKNQMYFTSLLEEDSYKNNRKNTSPDLNKTNRNNSNTIFDHNPYFNQQSSSSTNIFQVKELRKNKIKSKNYHSLKHILELKNQNSDKRQCMLKENDYYTSE